MITKGGTGSGSKGSTIKDIIAGLDDKQRVILAQKLKKEKARRAGAKAKSFEYLVEKVINQVIMKLKDISEE